MKKIQKEVLTIATLFCSMLEQLLIKTALSKEALLSLFDSDCPRYAQKVLRELTKSKYVRFRDETYKGGHGVKTIRYYSITPEGVRFLIQIANDDMSRKEPKRKTSLPWLVYMDEEDTKGMSVFGDLRQERERILSVGEAALVSEMAGADIPFFLHDYYTPIGEISQYQELNTPEIVSAALEMETASLSPEQKTYRDLEKSREEARKRDPGIHSAKTAQELIAEAAVSWMQDVSGPEWTYRKVMDTLIYSEGRLYKGYNPEEDWNYIRFVHPGTVKLVALMNHQGAYQDKHDTDRGRYAGLLQSRKATLLLYPAHRPELVWSQQYSKAEEVAFTRWHSRLLPEFKKNTGAVSGTSLMESAAKWAKRWRERRPELKQHRELGHRFAHLYLTEISPAGEKKLRDIMLNSEEEYVNGMVAQALEPEFGEALGYPFERNDGFASDEFPLRVRTEDGIIYFAIGTRIDLRQIIRLCSLLAHSSRSIPLGILCLPWQEGYYKTMLPQARLYWKGKTTKQYNGNP